MLTSLELELHVPVELPNAGSGNQIWVPLSLQHVLLTTVLSLQALKVPLAVFFLK